MPNWKLLWSIQTSSLCIGQRLPMLVFATTLGVANICAHNVGIATQKTSIGIRRPMHSDRNLNVLLGEFSQSHSFPFPQHKIAIKLLLAVVIRCHLKTEIVFLLEMDKTRKTVFAT